MSGRAISNPQHAQQAFDSDPQLYRDVPDLHAVPSPSHSALMDSTHFDDFAFAYHGLPDQSSLVSVADHTLTSQSPTAFPQHQAMSGLAHSEHGRLRSPPDRTSPASNAFEDPTIDEFGLASRYRADGTDLGGKPKEDKADATPAWSGLQTKAGKERKRLPLACIACRRKKIRCSGEKPTCKDCLRSYIPCVYKVTTRKAAPRTDNMAMLHKRPKLMEERFIKVIPKSDQEVASSVTRPMVKPAIPGTVPSSKPTKKRGAEEAFGPDLEAWTKAPSEPRIEGDDGPSSLQVQEGEENKLQHEGTEALPSKEIQEHLAEVFFDNICGQSYHLLHKPSYMRKLKNGTLPPVLVLTVCAVAARFISNPLVSSSGPEFVCGEEWASHARDICTRRYEWPNLTILTCLLILGLHEFGTCQGGRSWALGGQAIRMAFALQLYKDLEYDPSGFLRYGDWFSHDPHGLSDAEFMDPATHKRKDLGADGVFEAKPELQSVEEYYSTLPAPHNVENKDTIRAAAPKRKQSAKKQTGMPAKPDQRLDSLQSTDADAVSQERKFSGVLGLQTTGAAGFDPLAASNPQNPAFSTTMSPMSPANMTPFAHHAHTPTFFPPELLAMNFGQGSNGNINPLDRQLVYGGYSMDASTGLGGGQDMISGLDWDTVASGTQPDGGLQGRRSKVKAGMHGQNAGMADGPGLSGPEASSAWFMSFNMEPPDMGQDPGFNMGGIDPFT
ncbi:putative transcriptional regulatory protein [Fusarium oxysporum f. sp. raphani]|uniref:Putative transcriptional regulatory protein n=1 Tax=Fusarium oxysporum f. sp. raphani TaxID=96318 RepID=A0A8J5NVB5_FUSOX|nr:putative transcriptional regulatory protein [Fusarium oxysporum f. sp. raphani]